MNRAPATVAISFAASLAFWGCGGRLAYGEMEEPSIVLSQPLGQTIPGAPQTPITLPPGILTFTFDLPDIPIAGSATTTEQAGFTIHTSMKLNQAALIMPPSTPADFNGLDTLALTISSGSRSQVLARYTKDPAHPPGQTLRFVPADDVELLEYFAGSGAGSGTLTLGISGSGTFPANDWTADLDLDVRLNATAGWP